MVAPTGIERYNGEGGYLYSDVVVPPKRSSISMLPFYKITNIKTRTCCVHPTSLLQLANIITIERICL